MIKAKNEPLLRIAIVNMVEGEAAVEKEVVAEKEARIKETKCLVQAKIVGDATGDPTEGNAIVAQNQRQTEKVLVKESGKCKWIKKSLEKKNSRREEEEISTDSVEITVEKLIAIALIGVGALIVPVGMTKGVAR